MSLSLSMTSKFASMLPALFNPSKAMPAVMAPSPMIATARRSRPAFCAATAMPKAAEIEVLECPVPNASYSLSLRLGKPAMPLALRKFAMASRRPVKILCG